MVTINGNLSSLYAVFNFNIANQGLTRSIARLSSGSKLADPSEDPAGVAVVAKFESSIKKLNAMSDSVQTLISFAQTTDGFLTTIQDELTRMSELAARASNGAFSASDRANYAVEFDELTTNITDQVTNASFNGSAVFGTSGTISAAVTGDGSLFYDIALRNLNDTSGGSLDGLNVLDISTTSGASAAIGQLDTLIANITTDRAHVNSDVSNLEFHVQNLDTESLNLSSAKSAIEDVDFAEESTQLAKYSILSQSSAAVIAQANTSMKTVLDLLR